MIGERRYTYQVTKSEIVIHHIYALQTTHTRSWERIVKYRLVLGNRNFMMNQYTNV